MEQKENQTTTQRVEGNGNNTHPNRVESDKAKHTTEHHTYHRYGLSCYLHCHSFQGPRTMSMSLSQVKSHLKFFIMPMALYISSRHESSTSIQPSDTSQ
jgi:hypothetical protein